MKLLSRIALPLLSLWLLGWIALSWTAIQDDALIHLRYADYLHRVHFITFDGVHPSYGTSSLLYVGLLATFRTLTTSPLLSRYVSTFFHLVLFTAFAVFYLRAAKNGVSPRVKMFSLAILLLLAVPSAVRWLDDGMETGLVLCLVTSIVWFTHRLSFRAQTTQTDYLVGAVLGFLLVILRNELAIVALFASLILCLAAAGNSAPGWFSRFIRAAPARSHLFAGAVLAAIAIRLVMHSFLPDTALAKSHGLPNAIGSLIASAEVTVGALLFGVGTFVLWLISAVMVLVESHARRQVLLPTLAANALLPAVLLASSSRGQEVQGVRYLIWIFFFSIVWNLLELRRLDASSSQATRPLVFAAFIAVCLLALPTESHLMYRVLTTRARTMRQFMSQDLAAALPGKLGIAIDVGYISYYTHDPICDAAGLVNGREAAALSVPQRVQRCAAQHPDFAFVNADQAGTISKGGFRFDDWRVCGQYDFANMHQPDRHYLVVKPELAAATCAATGYPEAPIQAAYVVGAY